MFFVLLFIELAGLGTLVAELWTGIAVTGWQGEKPYVEKKDQPVHYWVIISVHIIVGVIVPGLAIYFQF